MPTFAIYEVVGKLRQRIEALENERRPIRDGVLFLLKLEQEKRATQYESHLTSIEMYGGEKAATSTALAMAEEKRLELEEVERIIGRMNG